MYWQNLECKFSKPESTQVRNRYIKKSIGTFWKFFLSTERLITCCLLGKNFLWKRELIFYFRNCKFIKCMFAGLKKKLCWIASKILISQSFWWGCFFTFLSSPKGSKCWSKSSLAIGKGSSLLFVFMFHAVCSKTVKTHSKFVCKCLLVKRNRKTNISFWSRLKITLFELSEKLKSNVLDWMK